MRNIKFRTGNWKDALLGVSFLLYKIKKGVRRLADGTIKIGIDLDSSQLEQELGKMGSAGEDATKSDDLHPLTILY